MCINTHHFSPDLINIGMQIKVFPPMLIMNRLNIRLKFGDSFIKWYLRLMRVAKSDSKSSCSTFYYNVTWHNQVEFFEKFINCLKIFIYHLLVQIRWTITFLFWFHILLSDYYGIIWVTIHVNGNGKIIIVFEN